MNLKGQYFWPPIHLFFIINMSIQYPIPHF